MDHQHILLSVMSVRMQLQQSAQFEHHKVYAWNMTLDNYATMLRGSLRQRWMQLPSPFNVPALFGISDYSEVDRRVRKGIAQRWPLNSTSQAGFIFQAGDGPKECWVDAMETKHDYRRIFMQFLRDEYQIDYRLENTKFNANGHYQIDHAHCCISVMKKNDVKYVLLTPLKRSINAGWAHIERSLAYDGSGSASTQVANYLTIAKVCELRAPSIAKQANLHEQVSKIYGSMNEAGLLDSFEIDLDRTSLLQFLKQAQNGAEKARAERNRRKVAVCPRP